MNVLTRVAFSGSAAWISTIANVPNTPLFNQKERTEINVPSTISSIDDIEIYEKKYGCKFQFVHRWRGKEVYGAREFLKHQRKEQEWQNGWSRVLYEKANENKRRCQNKEKMVFNWNNHSKRLEFKTNLN